MSITKLILITFYISQGYLDQISSTTVTTTTTKNIENSASNLLDIEQKIPTEIKENKTKIVLNEKQIEEIMNLLNSENLTQPVTAASEFITTTEISQNISETEKNVPNKNNTTNENKIQLIPPAGVAANIAKINEPPEVGNAIIISTNPDSQCPSLEDADNLSQTQMLQRLTHQCRYDRLERPVTYDKNGKKLPVNVYARAYLYFLQNLEAHDLQFKIHVLLQLRYVDSRLVFQKVSPKRTQPIFGEQSLRSSIWVPHIFFANERDSDILGTAEKDILTSISPDGTIIISTRIRATLYCWMNLQKFPFDEQHCSTVLESWMYNTSELILHWEKESPIALAPELHLTEYVLLNVRSNETTINADLRDLRHGAFAGNYSSLSFTVHLAREMGFYLMDYFLPSMMIVAISWVSFWLQADQSAPRIMLGTSTMLTFITLASTQGKTLPKVSYIKVSEVWFLGCTGFIFGSLVEFAFVNTIWRRKQNVELKKVNSKYILKSTLTPRPGRKEMSFQKSRSCSSLVGAYDDSNAQPFNNYLTVHGYSSSKNTFPTINTQSTNVSNRSNDTIQISMEPIADLRESLSMNRDYSPCPTPLPKYENGNENKDNKTSNTTWTTMTPQEISMWIDRRSRFIFPAAFLVFNVIFWTFVYCL